MEWIERYKPDQEPSLSDIDAFVGTPLWGELNAFLREGYQVEPEVSYSGCSGQPGWNVKYRKAGRALCTLYPKDGFFIALVVIGAKEYDEALDVLGGCTPYVRDLFEQTKPLMNQRWLMIRVTDDDILDDVKQLVRTRRKPKR